VAGPSLITGATGFAGGHLLERLVADGERVHAWGHRKDNTPQGDRTVTWTAVDLLDPAAVRAALDAARPAVIYHCAGLADVHDAWRAPAQALRVNVLGTHNLLEAARALELSCRVLVTASALVYRPSLTKISEDDPIGTAHPYSVSKLAQEMTAAVSPVPAWLVRPFNHAGPRQSPAYATSAFAQQIAEIEAGRREPVLHVGNLDAERDITDVRDTVRAYQMIAAAGQTRRPYNVCSGRAHTMRRLLDILLSLTPVRVRIEIDPTRLRPSDNPIVLGSHARLTAETGWTPAIPIEQTLADLLDYWRRG
jgi:GDP-4-dehydro-6-deoxy-D-mannose reductase